MKDKSQRYFSFIYLFLLYFYFFQKKINNYDNSDGFWCHHLVMKIMLLQNYYLHNQLLKLCWHNANFCNWKLKQTNSDVAALSYKCSNKLPRIDNSDEAVLIWELIQWKVVTQVLLECHIHYLLERFRVWCDCPQCLLVNRRNNRALFKPGCKC